MKFRLISATVIAVGIGLAGAGFAQERVVERGFQGQPPSGEGFDKPLAERLRVGATIPTFNHPAFVAIMAGMQQAAEDFNIDLTVLDGENDPNQQLAQIETFISQGVDAIMIDAVDETALAAGGIAANEAAIPVMHFDRRVTGGGEYFVYVGSEWILNGAQSGMQIVQLMNGEGNLVVIEGTVGSAVTRERGDGALAVVDLYPDLKVIESQSGDFNRTEAQRVVENILQAHPEDIDGMWFMNDEMYFGAYPAIEASGRRDEMMLMSIDGDRRACEAIQRGELDGNILLDIYGMGYEPVRAVAHYLNGRRDFPEWIKLWTTPIDASNIDQFIDKCW